MITEKEAQEIKVISEEFFCKIDPHAKVSVDSSGESLLVSIDMDQPQRWIGQNGQTLMDIQHLLRIITKKKIGEDCRLELDINEYKKKKISYLTETAAMIANEVAFTGKEKALPPMSSYERRIIHVALKDRGDIVAQSEGEGDMRKVVIRPLLSKN